MKTRLLHFDPTRPRPKRILALTIPETSPAFHLICKVERLTTDDPAMIRTLEDVIDSLMRSKPEKVG